MHAPGLLLLLSLLLPILGAAVPAKAPKSNSTAPRAVTFSGGPARCSTNSACTCSTDAEGKLTATCRHKAKGFPVGLPANLSVLTINCDQKKDSDGRPVFDFELMTAIPANALSKTPRLEELTISSCPIMELPPFAFAKLPRLRSLSLQSLLLRRLAGTLLHGSYNLQSLQIIDMVDLAAVDPVLLGAQTRLATLLLKRTSLPGPAVNLMLAPVRKTLRLLTWSMSRVPVTLPVGMFKGCRLRELDLNYNRLTSMDFLLHTRVRKLSLRGNREMATMPPFDFSRCKELRSLIQLDLRSCNLRQLPAGSLVHMKRLRKLYLSDNRLRQVPPDIYTSSLSLVVSSLDLSNNHIQTVPARMEKLFRRDGFIALLSNNRYHCNCEAAWLLRYRKFLRGVRCTSAPEGHDWLRQREMLSLKAAVLTCKRPSVPTILATNAVQTFSSRVRLIGSSGYRRSVPTQLIRYRGKSKVVYISRGQAITFRCTSKGDPAPTMEWLFPWGAGLKRTAPTDRTIFGNEVKADLQHMYIRLHTQANFTCIASNIAGNQSDYVTVINTDPVLSTPRTPREPNGKVTPKASSRNKVDAVVSSWRLITLFITGPLMARLLRHL